MKKGRFLWSAHRITEKPKAGKARNIKEKQLKNSRNTVSKPLVVLRSSQKDNLLSIQTLRWKHLGVFLCPTLRVLAACASAALAKNSPPDCFLHARTVLKKIIFYLSKHSGGNTWVFFFALHCGSSRRFIKISTHTSVLTNCVRPYGTSNAKSSPRGAFYFKHYFLCAE